MKNLHYGGEVPGYTMGLQLRPLNKLFKLLWSSRFGGFNMVMCFQGNLWDCKYGPPNMTDEILLIAEIWRVLYFLFFYGAVKELVEVASFNYFL